MADDDAEEQHPSLEPPRLFRRRPKKKVPIEADDAVADETEVIDDPVAADEPVEDDVDEEQESDEEPEAVVAGSAAPAASTTEPERTPEPAPEPEPEPEPKPAPETEAEPEPEPAAEAEEQPGFTDAATVPVHVGGGHDERAPDPAPETTSPAEPVATEEEHETAEPRTPRGPLLVGRNAALATGLVVGVLMLLLGAGGSATCEAVRGTSACGAALGIPILVLIVALAVAAGALLLRLFRIPDPAATSFMAVALVAVVTGLFLTDALGSWPARIVYPVGVALAFLASWWLAVSFDDPDVVRRARAEREREQEVT